MMNKQNWYSTFLIAFYSFIFIQSVSAQETVLWSDPIPVSEEGFSNKGPKIGLNAANEPVVMWGQSGSNGGLYVAKWENGIFTTPQKVNGSITPLINSAEGPQLKSKGDLIFITFQDLNDDYTGIYLVKSVDGGVTFSDPIQVISNSVSTNILPFIGIDENDNPVVGALNAVGQFANAKMILFHSTDGGITFNDGVIASEFSNGSYVCECCPGFLMHDGSTEYLFFRNNDNNVRDIWMTFSEDGINYDNGLDIDESDWDFNVCPASGPQAAKFGEQLVAVHMNGASDIAQVYFSEIDPVSNTLINNERITGDAYLDIVQNFPTVAGQNSTIGIAWQQSTGFDRDIFFTYATESVDEFETNIFNITSASDYNQVYPSLAYDGEKFHLIYEEQNESKVFYQVGEFGIPSNSTEVNTESPAFILSTLFHDDLIIEVNEPLVETSIFGLNGTIFWSAEQINEQTSLSTENWAAGIYFLKYQDEKKTIYFQKLIKQ